MPSTTRLPAAERRRQLLDVALGVFAREGYHQASMNDVAEAAGVTKPVLYQHFESKRELYLELLRDVGGRLEGAIARATEGAGGPRQQVEAGLGAYFAFVADRRDAFQLLFTGGSRADDEFLVVAQHVEASIARFVADLIEVEGLDPAHRTLLAHGVVGVAEATSRYWLADPQGLSPERLAAQVAELVWAGLRGVRQG
ncbi:MAG: TetR/AcrR family transcriptional regulator [Acidimicrobiales bacterium]|nr:TetR/AcrR family transcriptional regulator [Acidimicrobiales bacterium]MCB1013659.1 TetR/AcrR family transcriptional regulator [Acidimicrobiales bacterium]